MNTTLFDALANNVKPSASLKPFSSSSNLHRQSQKEAWCSGKLWRRLKGRARNSIGQGKINDY